MRYDICNLENRKEFDLDYIDEDTTGTKDDEETTGFSKASIK